MYWFVSNDSVKSEKSRLGDCACEEASIEVSGKTSASEGIVMKQQKKRNIFHTEMRR